MKMIAKALILLSLMIGSQCASIVRKRSTNLPAWIECTSNLDCAPGYCCIIAHERYSYPSCQRLHEEGEFCRPGGPLTTNGTRRYPDDLEITLDDVYLQFCPCIIGFVCDHDDHTCRDASQMKDFNYLISRSNKKDD